MSEKRGEITFAGPPRKGIPWARAVIALVVIGAAAWFARERFRGRVAERGAILQDLQREYLAVAETLDWQEDLDRERPGPPLGTTEIGRLLSSGEMTRDQVLIEMRRRRPYRGPAGADLDARWAASQSRLQALYDRADRVGLARDEADLRVVRQALAATSTAILVADEDAVPDVPGAVRTVRERAGLSPIDPQAK